MPRYTAEFKSTFDLSSQLKAYQRRRARDERRQFAD